jgi:hypothetical protein
MALVHTSKAIGAVSKAIKERLDNVSGATVSIGRPDKLVGTPPLLNLFLYEIQYEPNLKNTPLNDGEKPPLWLVLKYMMTAFIDKETSDSADAHELLGRVLRLLQQDDLLSLKALPGAIVEALDSNPSELHLTMDEGNSDLLAKVMQGPDEKLRLSICFQVRPVMIAPADPPNYSLLVGVDYTQPPVSLTPAPVGLDVIPSMGASIETIFPTGFEVGEEVTIRGTDLHLSNLAVKLGPVELPVTMQRPDELRFKVDPAIIAASGISAGSHPVTLVQTLFGTGKKRGSNAVIANLVPTLNSAAIVGAVQPGVAPPPDTAFATIDLSGLLLGKEEDDAVVAFYRDGIVFKIFDVFDPVPPPDPQTVRRFAMTQNDAIEEGDYFIILKVNGQQAPQSPVVHLFAP